MIGDLFHHKPIITTKRFITAIDHCKKRISDFSESGDRLQIGK